jgi:phosphoribosyl 1,2-cyclic phosphodiesterase
MTPKKAIKNRPDQQDQGGLSVCMLASGSKGNAIYISDGSTAILIDAGLSGVAIERRLRARGLSPENLSAIVVSHEHGDHIQGVGVLSRRYGLPIYISKGTHSAAGAQLGKIQEATHFSCGTAFQINALTLHPFSISHDARDPSGFTVQSNGLKIGVATDLGIATSLVKEHLKECTALVIEANHDPEMLETGPYPWHLKQRVRGRSGHLSNSDTRALVEELQHDGLTHVILAHLSETNNTPEKALNTVAPGLNRCQTRIEVASQSESGLLLHIGR